MIGICERDWGCSDDRPYESDQLGLCVRVLSAGGCEGMGAELGEHQFRRQV